MLNRRGFLASTAALASAFGQSTQTPVNDAECQSGSDCSADLSFHAIGAEPLGLVPAGAIVLHDGWWLGEERVVGNEGARFSSFAFQAEKWRETSVPTTVLGALVRHGVYPDPYVGTNNDRIPDASAEGSPWSRPWWFRRTFEIPASYTGKTTWLHLDGINYRAAVWVNGVQVANEHDLAGMFRRFRLDISNMVKPGRQNALAIRIFPMDFAGVPGYRRAGADTVFEKNVTEMSALGWDWVPPARDRNMGLWQHVWIQSTGPAAVWDSAVFTDVQLPEGKTAALTVRLQLENTRPEPVEMEMNVRIEPSGFPGSAIEVRKQVRLSQRGQQEVILTPEEFPALHMQAPRLWWPNGYGGQPLYQLTVELCAGGVVSHRQATRFGVRKIGYFYRPAELAHTMQPIPDGLRPADYPPMQAARVFTINGREIRMAGGAIVPDFLLSFDAQRYRDEARLMAEGNHTIARIWGGGILMPDVFYEEADRRGLLVWQDLARSSFSAAWGKREAEIPAADKDLYLANMRDSILRLRGRTSLFLWCGTNENAMQTDIGKALQDELLPALDGTRPWLPSSSTEPPWATEPLGVRSFGPYLMRDLQFYFDKYAHSTDFRFKNEIGLESTPRYNSIARAIPGLDKPGPDGGWATQVLLDHGLPMKSLVPRIAARIGAPTGLADFVAMSELLSAQGYRAIFEAANKNRPRNQGTMVWMTNAAWLDFMYQLYDWYLQPTASYYAVKSASKPLHVQYAFDDHTLQVASILADRRAVKVRATVLSAAGRTEETRDYELMAEGDATTSVGPAPGAVADGNFHFLRLELRDANGRELDRTMTWTQNDEKWDALLTLPPVAVSARIVDMAKGRVETQCRVLVRNGGTVPAVHTWVGLIRGREGEDILPCFWSDNALTLAPGEERELSVRFRNEHAGSPAPRLIVDGFNVQPAEFGVEPGAAASRLSVRVDEVSYRERELRIRCSQTGAAGARWITWPIAVELDGRILRTVRVALRGEGGATLRFPLDAAPGPHRVQAGGKSVEFQV